MTRHLVVGTAGHIDHGKSALVRALTGIDPDRLKEEKARGITIDLGFAHWHDGDRTVAFVDVPGHERFVRNMRAKVQGVALVECVVMPDGTVSNAHIVKSLDSVFGLDQEAIKAARLWRFVPGKRFGQPVPVIVTIELTFTLR